MKKIVCLLLLFLLAGCSARTNDLTSETNRIEPPPSIEESGSSEEESQTDDPDVIFFDYNETTEKYYDYFRMNSHFSMLLSNETGGEGFTDAEMAVYALCELILQSNGTYDQAVGFPKENMDAMTEKIFGATVQNYETRWTTVIPQTGNITSTGWGGNAVGLVLKELKTGANGISTGVFYLFSFGMEGIPPTTKTDLLQGRFNDYGEPFLITIVFEEKTDENDEMFLRYYKVQSEGKAQPPYVPYQG